jgi:hypothetical protein
MNNINEHTIAKIYLVFETRSYGLKGYKIYAWQKVTQFNTFFKRIKV